MVATIRSPAVAGLFYPADAQWLVQAVNYLLAKAKPHNLKPKVLIVPHAGYRYSGIVAATAYASLYSVASMIEGVVLLIRTGWDGLVVLLDRGGYARYDYKTATKLLAVSQTLLDCYAGNLNRLHAAARDSDDLALRVMSLGKGVGPVTAQIFLRNCAAAGIKPRPPWLHWLFKQPMHWDFCRKIVMTMTNWR